jgi:hypothetical protein
MSKTPRIGAVFAVLFTLAVAAETSFAESRHTYVDPTVAASRQIGGLPGQQPSQPCDSPQRPCKSIAEALSITKNGGTVTLLKADPADAEGSNKCTISYSTSVPLRIDKSITIDAQRGLKARPCFSIGREVTGIVIGSNQTPNVVVNLRALRFVHGDGGSIAIALKGGSKLKIDNCYFEIYHGVSVTGDGDLKVIDSIFSAGKGIMLEKVPHKSLALIDRCKFLGHNDVAILARENRAVTVTNSEFVKVDSAFWLYDNASLLLRDSNISFTEPPFQFYGKPSVTMNGVVITRSP